MSPFSQRPHMLSVVVLAASIPPRLACWGQNGGHAPRTNKPRKKFDIEMRKLASDENVTFCKIVQIF